MEIYFLTALLFFLPFLLIVSLPVSPEIPKVICAELFIQILLLFYLFKHGFSLKRFSHTQLILIGILFFISLVHAVLSPNNGIFGNIFRLQGVFLFWNLLIFSLLASHYKLLKQANIIAFLGLIGLVITTLIFNPNTAGRSIGTLGEPNALAAVGLFFFPFVLSKPTKAIWLASAALVLFLLFKTGSFSGMVGFGLELVLFGLFQVKHLSKTISIGIVAALFLCSFSLPFFQDHANDIRFLFTHVKPAVSPYQYEQRSVIWQTALDAALVSPILGQGFGNTEHLIHTQALKENNNLQYVVVDSAHNIFIDMFLNLGLVGLVVFVWLIFSSIKHHLHRNDTTSLICLFGVITAVSFNPTSVCVLLAIWYLIGSGFSKKSL